MEKKFGKDKKFYRARNSPKNEKYRVDQMGKPSNELAINGRANPIGISYLYTASDISTAISEIKPSLQDKISVAEILIVDSLRLIDLRYVSPFSFADDEDFDVLIQDINFLIKLSQDLSKPINPKDAVLEYLPTQYLCELIKASGWDGVAYKSSFAEGFNIAIFLEEKISINRVDSYVVEKINLEYKRI